MSLASRTILLSALVAVVVAAGGGTTATTTKRQQHHRDGTTKSPCHPPPPRTSVGDVRRGGGGWQFVLPRRRPSLILPSSSSSTTVWSYRSSSMRGGGAGEGERWAEEADDGTVVVVPDADETTSSGADDESSSSSSSSSPPVDDDDAAEGVVPTDDGRKDLPSNNSINNLTFAATKPHDGSLDDPDGIPRRFLLMKKNDRKEAKAAFESTLSWRREYDVDTVLSRSHVKFDICKAMLPHYFSGRDPHGNVILVQRPAALDFELMRRNNSTIDDLLMHYIYVIEYCWNILEPGPPDGEMTNVLDMRGMTFGIMRNQEYIGFGKRFVHMMSENYPGRSYKTLVINAPRWFHALYKIFKPVLRESTRQKIVILKAGEQQDTALRFYLGDSLPRDLISNGGKGTGGDDEAGGEDVTPSGVRYFIPVGESVDCEPGPNSLLEFEMRQFCIEQLKLHNATMQDVI